jgi:hypothetical protein
MLLNNPTHQGCLYSPSSITSRVYVALSRWLITRNLFDAVRPYAYQA